MIQYVDIVSTDPAVETVAPSRAEAGRIPPILTFAQAPFGTQSSAARVVNRLRPKLAGVPGATFFLQPVQDVKSADARQRAVSIHAGRR